MLVLVFSLLCRKLVQISYYVHKQKYPKQSHFVFLTEHIKHARKQRKRKRQYRKLNLLNNFILIELQHAILNTGKTLSKNTNTFTCTIFEKKKKKHFKRPPSLSKWKHKNLIVLFCFCFLIMKYMCGKKNNYTLKKIEELRAYFQLKSLLWTANLTIPRCSFSSSSPTSLESLVCTLVKLGFLHSFGYFIHWSATKISQENVWHKERLSVCHWILLTVVKWGLIPLLELLFLSSQIHSL